MLNFRVFGGFQSTGRMLSRRRCNGRCLVLAESWPVQLHMRLAKHTRLEGPPSITQQYADLALMSYGYLLPLAP